MRKINLILLFLTFVILNTLTKTIFYIYELIYEPIYYLEYIITKYPPRNILENIFDFSKTIRLYML